jgi:hypothetical protein
MLRESRHGIGASNAASNVHTVRHT